MRPRSGNDDCVTSTQELQEWHNPDAACASKGLHVEPPFPLTHRDAHLPVAMPSSRTLLIGLAVLVVVGIGGAAFAGCTTIQIQEEDVFLPKPSITPQTFTSDIVNLREVYVDNDSVRLNAWHLARPDARGTILFFGGNGFYLVQSGGYVEALTDFPVNVLMFDYRGYGKSTGAPGVEGFKSDALRMYDYAVDSLDAAPERMLVHGIRWARSWRVIPRRSATWPGWF